MYEYYRCIWNAKANIYIKKIYLQFNLSTYGTGQTWIFSILDGQFGFNHENFQTQTMANTIQCFELFYILFSGSRCTNTLEDVLLRWNAWIIRIFPYLLAILFSIIFAFSFIWIARDFFWGEGNRLFITTHHITRLKLTQVIPSSLCIFIRFVHYLHGQINFGNM